MTADTHKSLSDNFGRSIKYLRLSVTDRCDFRCTYCMAEDMTFLPRERILSLEQMLAVADSFVSLGVKKIRLTGGEPLIRKNILWLAERIAALPGLDELCLTTNGARLDEYAAPLRAAGLKRINISLDSLNPIRFQQITRVGRLDKVLRGIDAACAAGFERIKINSVIQSNKNLDEVSQLIRFCLERNIDISFIEEMPLGTITSHSRRNEFVSSAALREHINTEFSLRASNDSTGGPSRYWNIPGTDTRVGFISPHSENFCATCNRVRVTAEGRLLLCLGNENSVDLKKIYEQTHGDTEALKRAIVEAMHDKPERHHFDLDTEPQIVRFMNMTGG